MSSVYVLNNSFYQDHQLTNTAPEKAVREYMTNELRDPKLHVEQIKNNCKINQLKQEVKNTKSLNSECILNKKATELAETNVRYVFDFQQYLNCIYMHIPLYPHTH